MTDFSQLVPEHIRNLGGYTPGRSARHPEDKSHRIKLASNENPFGPSPRAVEAVQAVLAGCNCYPDNDSGELLRKLAQHHSLEPEQIVPGAGLTSLLGVISRTLLAPGLNAVTSARSFIVYPLAVRAAGGRMVEVPMSGDGLDLNAMAAAMDRNTRIVFLANPNNPTGTLITPDELDRFLDQVPEHVIVVLDEAYYDYARHFANIRGTEYSHSFDYVRQGRNVIVLRTFSKAHGLAGLRVGYAMGPAKLMAHFARTRTTFSVSVVAQAAALAALDDDAHTRKALENNAAQAPILLDAISALGFRVVPTWANFLYCELGEDAATVSKRLQAEGVLIRPLGPWGAPTAIRVTVGTPEQNVVFLRAFKKVMAQAAQR